jgi:hypothetical protein
MKLHPATIAVFGMLLLSGIAEAQTMCPMIYQPVCALKVGGERATFGNKCEADRAGAKILHDGTCEADAACNKIAQPVCAIHAGKEKTYLNLCRAKKDSATFLHDGTCGS